MKNIFITEGDPTGISYEIFDETLKLLKKKCKQFRFILVSSQNQISSKAEKEFLSINSRTSIEPALKDKASSKIISFKNTILSKKEEKELKPGNPSVLSGKVAFVSLLTAIELQKRFGGDIITLPLSKEWVIKAGVEDFKGHTEVFASEYNKKTVMLMYGNNLKVIPLTTHIPLNNVSSESSKPSRRPPRPSSPISASHVRVSRWPGSIPTQARMERLEEKKSKSSSLI